MKFIKKFVSFIKNLFNKSTEVKKIDASHKNNLLDEKKSKFIDSLAINNSNENTTHIVETLVNEGDGLGIRKKLIP